MGDAVSWGGVTKFIQAVEITMEYLNKQKNIAQKLGTQVH